MATVDRAKLLADTKLWLPDTNTLSDAHLTSINESVISAVGDDDQYYGEILCKSLQAAAAANNAMASVDSANLQRERVGNVELYYDSKHETWRDYIANLPAICAIFGYELVTATGMVINTGNPNGGPADSPVSDCCTTQTSSSSFFVK